MIQQDQVHETINPYLSDQTDYLSRNRWDLIDRNPSSSLMQYGPESVLRGQNVVSMFGTNDYRDQLEKKKIILKTELVKEKIIVKLNTKKLLKEIRDFEKAEINKESWLKKKKQEIKLQEIL